MTYGSREARRYYGIDDWSNGYFNVNARGRTPIIVP